MQSEVGQGGPMPAQSFCSYKRALKCHTIRTSQTSRMRHAPMRPYIHCMGAFTSENCTTPVGHAPELQLAKAKRPWDRRSRARCSRNVTVSAPGRGNCSIQHSIQHSGCRPLLCSNEWCWKWRTDSQRAVPKKAQNAHEQWLACTCMRTRTCACTHTDCPAIITRIYIIRHDNGQSHTGPNLL